MDTIKAATSVKVPSFVMENNDNFKGKSSLELNATGPKIHNSPIEKQNSKCDETSDKNDRQNLHGQFNTRRFIVIPSTSSTPVSTPYMTWNLPQTATSSLSAISPPAAIVVPTIETTPTSESSSNGQQSVNASGNDNNGRLINQSDAIHQNENGQTTTLTTAAITAGCSLPITSINPTLAVTMRPKLHNSTRSVVSATAENVEDSKSPTTSLTAPSTSRMLRTSSYNFSDTVASRLFPDATSIRSLASIGMGSTDGRKLVIRRVPNSPDELFSLMSPPPQIPVLLKIPEVVVTMPPHMALVPDTTSPLETASKISDQPQFNFSRVAKIPQGEDDEDDDSYCDISDDPESPNLKPRRQHWANKMQFVLACVGYSVGLGNVWRFPYLCYRSGGGVFLVPYFIILVICSVPMLFMELSVGQYTGRGPIGALGQICPLFKGAGLASVIVSFLMSTYYSVIIAYAVYYFFTSFKPIMPWTDCNNRWNTPDCWVPHHKQINMTPSDLSRTPSEEFFENKVLQISPGIQFPGSMRWELFACLICAWLLVYFAIWKSIKSSAKVRYFTATFPFVLIIVFMGRALTLEGAEDGLRYFFRPQWEELRNANVWINAASQNFNSLGIAFGSMISFASYNKYNNNILHDTLAVSLVNALTSILVGVFAFATLGNLAYEQNTNVKDVISDGPGFIFVVYPQAMAKMPAGQMWAVMFFFMLLCLGLNSQFAIVEVVVTSIQDGFPNWIKRKLVYHELLVLIICAVSFLLGLPNLIQGGIYFFQLMDHYAASISIMFVAFFQMVAIAWCYGTERLSKNVKQMTGKSPSLYIRSCWLVCAPLFLISLWILSLINYQEPTYHNGKYNYPLWAYGVGWAISSMSLICIPGYAIVSIIRAPGDKFCDKLLNSIKPNIYECKICGEHHCEHDFPEEQYMITQEMTPIIQPKIILKTPPPGHLNRIEPPLLSMKNKNNDESNENSDAAKC